MPKTVLIAGGSGLIGTGIIQELIKKGYEVKLLGRTATKIPQVETFVWDPQNGKIDERAFIHTDYIINLAGANVGKGRWTPQRKKELVESRIKSTELLIQQIKKNNYPVKKFIQASAVGYYGFSNMDTEFTETTPMGNDFLAKLCGEWEKATAPLEGTTTQLLILRIGVVLSSSGGALAAMAAPVNFFAGSALGRGKQIVPWIHINDLIGIFLKGIDDPEMEGIYNATAPNPASNKELTVLIGKVLKRPVWPINIPSFILKMALGEQAQIVLEGNKVSSKKLINNGYLFKYPDLKEALKNLLTK